ncbi:pyocin activator PrtN family protein [Pseudoalteromonas peptidolytica]|uniref:Pyocin activator protein PrtN n=1 Tax=Pseudoalteromonas peptidolytica F12-50-A1 TaxID=1315280 RepID=A0A8I0MT64_9GAMM|nr:pyocin activator PrtN family protein [Pseudoalteromonas peptidolytica]MBE0344952.1 hypothetical protein [Pseudoalteromonas peptidolytica F12-50-A1]NLR15558.1 pyocin activator protein PrtN [Pseudoalteromonas peptidolytica]GEK08326.1 hypothetical protein PPE03_05750 [Pseudoalteromonas peptidolytica]
MTKARNATQTQTVYLLMAEYGAKIMIPLEDLALKVLGMSVNTAKRKAKSNELPFPAVKLNDSQKAPYLVHIQDLAAYIENQCSSARIEWGKAQCF